MYVSPEGVRFTSLDEAWGFVKRQEEQKDARPHPGVVGVTTALTSRKHRKLEVGGWRSADAPLGTWGELHATPATDDPPSTLEGEGEWRARKGRCGRCAGCQREDCGECFSCKSKIKFGGGGTLKQVR